MKFYALCTWSVQKVSQILNLHGLRIFDCRFFVALCWYSYPLLMPTSSVILNVQLICDGYFACFGSSSMFAPSVSGTRKSHRMPDLGNTVAAKTLLCCFWPKIRAQATMCQPGRYHGAKANFYCSTNPAFLTDCFAQIAHNLQVIFIIDPSTLKFWSICWNSQKSKTSQNMSKQNSCQKLTKHSKWPNLSG